MHRLLALFAVVLGVCVATPASAERGMITVTAEGHDLRVVVRGVTEYCATNAHTDILRQGGTIRIVRERPTAVSRCITTQDKTFVIKDVPAGRYTISYEQIPLVAPARALRLASTTAVMDE
jgi:type II secretory pathway component GspD/PulD (secretin)